MDIKASKIELVKMILNINSSEFIKKVTDFVSNEQADFWNDLTTLEKEEIRKGIDQLNKGTRVSFDDVLKKIS